MKRIRRGDDEEMIRVMKMMKTCEANKVDKKV